MEQEKTTNILSQNCLDQLQHSRSFSQVSVEILFDEQYPIQVEPCKIYTQLLNKQKIPSAQIQNQIVEKLETSNTQANQLNIIIQCSTSMNIEPLQANKMPNNLPFQLRIHIPMESVVCFGKKSSTKTLLMVKDKQKLIQRDQNGIELVSDEEQDFNEKIVNQLYLKVKNAINQPQKKYHQCQKKFDSITIDQKCSITFMLNQPELSQQLYNYFSQQLEIFEKQFNQHQHQFISNFDQFQQMGLNRNQNFELYQQESQNQGKDQQSIDNDESQEQDQDLQPQIDQNLQ